MSNGYPFRPICAGLRSDTSQLQRWRAGIATVIARRLDPRVEETAESRQFENASLVELAGEFLAMHGDSSVVGMERRSIFGRAMTHRTPLMSGADFPALLSDVVGKRLRRAYDEMRPSYLQWARRAVNAPDFRELQLIQLSNAPDLLPLGEQAEIKAGHLVDGVSASYAVATYARRLTLTRRDVINDDLRAFSRMVELVAAAARRLENKLVYAELTSGAAMADGLGLFHANHANLATGGGSALQDTSLAAGRKAMRQQRGLQGQLLSLSPAFLIVPSTLEGVASELTSITSAPAAVLAAGSADEARSAGLPFLAPVVEPLLDAASPTAWYLAAATRDVDTVEYCYLRSASGPDVRIKNTWNDGVEVRVVHDFAARAVDHRGLYKATGA